jgi:hypothetical protein
VKRHPRIVLLYRKAQGYNTFRHTLIRVMDRQTAFFVRVEDLYPMSALFNFGLDGLIRHVEMKVYFRQALFISLGINFDHWGHHALQPFLEKLIGDWIYAKEDS